MVLVARRRLVTHRNCRSLRIRAKSFADTYTNTDAHSESDADSDTGRGVAEQHARSTSYSDYG